VPSLKKKGLLTESATYAGDKLLSNKQLILGNLNVLNASLPLKKSSTVPFYLRYDF
jgi:hypothetical protein